MRIVFMGSAPLSCPSLDALCASELDEVVAAVTQPDRRKGRKLLASPCVLKVRALARGIPVLTPVDVNAPDALEALKRLAPDLIVVVAYGQFLGRELLGLPPVGCINVHASLLPAYRGAAPVAWAIVEGESETGVTVMRMNERMDAGDILSQRRVAIHPDETAGSLHDRLAKEGADLLVEAVDALRKGRTAAKSQPVRAASQARKLTKQDGRIDWTQPAAELYNRIRGFNPWPCCFCAANGGKLRVLTARVEDGSGVPGTVLDAAGGGPLIATGRGALRLLEVQPEGKNAMDGAAYLRGHSLSAGELLG